MTMELRDAAEFVCTTFEGDEAAGYQSKDRRFAIGILRQALAAERAARADRPAAPWSFGHATYYVTVQTDRPAAEVGETEKLVEEARTRGLNGAWAAYVAKTGAHYYNAACHAFFAGARVAYGIQSGVAFPDGALNSAPATRTTSPDAGEVRAAFIPECELVERLRGEDAPLMQTAADTIERLRGEVVFGFYEEEIPQFVQGYDKGVHELTSVVTAAECTGYVAKIALIPALDAAAAERAREACAKVAREVGDSSNDYAVGAGAFLVETRIRALSAADLLRPEGAQSEGETSR